jgi:hypothetical protein
MSTAPVIDASVLRNRKAQTFAVVGFAKNGDTNDIASVIPVTAGSGAPNHNAFVAGEIYIRTDGTAAAGTLLYAASDTSGTWAPIVNLSSFAPTVITLTDNTATALDITEGANSYLKFTTTNSAEKVTISKALALLLGIDLSGAASNISIIDNNAAALDIKEGSTSYIKCVTTNSSESVTLGKPLLLNGGLAPGSVFQSTEQTANGSPQNIAHGLGTAPSFVTAYVTDSGATGIYTLVPGAHDATNVVFNGTAGIKYRVQALK